MQSQFICYKSKFLNLELRRKLIKVLIRLLVKNTKAKSSRSTQPNPTQPNLRSNTLSSIGLEEIMNSIEFEFSQAEHVVLT